MVRRLIGTVYTDENGESVITYHGTSAGKMNIVMESGDFVSEPHEVIDCIYYDPGVDGNTNDSFYKSDYYVTRTLATDGTIIENTHTSTTKYYYALLPGATATSAAETKLLTGNVIVEIDIIEYTDGSFQVYSGGTRQLSSYGDAPFTIRFKVEDGNSYRWSYDTNDWVNMNSSVTAPYNFRIGLPHGATIKFKNLKIYPI